MSEQTIVKSEKVSSELEKLESLFNEEIYLRLDASAIPVTKFKIIDDLIDHYSSTDKLDKSKERVQEHLKDHPESIFARYIIGVISLMEDKVEDLTILKSLLEQFRQHSKWAIIEHISDKILKFGDQRLALKYKSEALEKLNKHKELKIVLKKLAKQDRKNPEIAKKYAYSILHDKDIENDKDSKKEAFEYLKQAAEYFAKGKDYTQLEEIWPILINNRYEDLPFFEKIERILLSNREKSRVVILLYPLVDKYKQIIEEYQDYEEIDKVIMLLKKVLEQDPLSPKARNELVKAYKIKYKNHSLLDEFLKLSEIGNNKKPVKLCITSFERNIVFDTNNYVLHRNWGVGKIVSISSETDSIIVDFKDKKQHKLSIQMALSSLKPLKKEHIWVKFYENEQSVKDLFLQNPSEFIKELIVSQDTQKMILGDIKTEIIGKFLSKNDDWSKWWAKTKLLLKKDPHIGFNPKKKDEVLYRAKAISLSEELVEKFNAQTDINKKIDIALEALEDIDAAEEAVENFAHFFYEEESSKEPIRRIIAYIFLEIASGKIDQEDLPRAQKPNDVYNILKSLSSEEILNLSKEISNVEIKKELVNLIQEAIENPTEILMGMLYEVPIKINKHVFNLLVQNGHYKELNTFIEAILSKSKEYPEVFLWVVKSILTRSWAYEWLNVPYIETALKLFRFLRPLQKLEEKGNKLKNSAIDILFGNKNEVLSEIIKDAEEDVLRKIYVLFKEVSYITEPEKDKLYGAIVYAHPNFKWEDSSLAEDMDDDVSSLLPKHGILVTKKAYNSRKERFDHLVNVEMAENSRDIGEAQEKGDLRENAEYKAAMERQSQLQAEAKKIEAELKNAKIIDFSTVKTNRINIGCTVKLKNLSSGNEETTYSILGPWDANTENNIISYLAPLGKSLLGKKVGDEAKIQFDKTVLNFKVLEITRYSA